MANGKQKLELIGRGNFSGQPEKSAVPVPSLIEWLVLEIRTAGGCPDLLPRPTHLDWQEKLAETGFADIKLCRFWNGAAWRRGGATIGRGFMGGAYA